MSKHIEDKLDELLAKCEGGNPHGDLFEPNPIQVGFKRLNENATLPTKAHASDSGFDLYASEDVIIEPGETTVVPTGIAVQLPGGYEATVRPRSGVTSRTKLRVQLGTIDQGYVGEIGIIVDNNHGVNYRIERGYKLAQLVVQPLPSVEAYEISGELGETERGTGGFGSTGVTKGVEKWSKHFY